MPLFFFIPADRAEMIIPQTSAPFQAQKHCKKFFDHAGILSKKRMLPSLLTERGASIWQRNPLTVIYKPNAGTGSQALVNTL